MKPMTMDEARRHSERTAHDVLNGGDDSWCVCGDANCVKYERFAEVVDAIRVQLAAAWDEGRSQGWDPHATNPYRDLAWEKGDAR